MRYILPLLALVTSGCLEPLVDDTIDPALVFGPADVAPDDQPHVEDLPEFASNVARFSRRVSRINGFANGEPVAYWNIDGPVTSLIANVYLIVDAAGNPVGRPVIDVIPGDSGYTPFWRKMTVRVTEQYNGEKIWSRDAVVVGAQLGILHPPEASTEVVDCPVVTRDTMVDLGGGEQAPATPVWYKNRQVHWVLFSGVVQVPLEDKAIPRYPVHTLQRSDEALPIFEFATQVDEDGDGRFDRSNNIFADAFEGPRYSPLWFLSKVRVVADYPSIDTTDGRGVGLTDERQFYDPATQSILPSAAAATSSTGQVLSVTEERETLINCPFERPGGGL